MAQPPLAQLLQVQRLLRLLRRLAELLQQPAAEQRPQGMGWGWRLTGRRANAAMRLSRTQQPGDSHPCSGERYKKGGLGEGAAQGMEQKGRVMSIGRGGRRTTYGKQ